MDFDDDMKMSLNKVWSWGNGTQWIRKAAANLWHWDITEMLDSWKKIPKIKEKVSIFLEFYFSTGSKWWWRQLDSSNCSALGKMIEDALKYDKEKNPNWILADDTNAQVGWFCVHSIELPLKARKELETSYVDVSIRKFKEEL
jgi:hypothetical protein